MPEIGSMDGGGLKKAVYSGYRQDFGYKHDAMKAQIMARLDEIRNKKNETTGIGMWQNPVLDETSPNHHRHYFLGVEVNDYKDIPYGMVIKNLPESKYAIFNESEYGTVMSKEDSGYFWLRKSNYQMNLKIIADFETYNFGKEKKIMKWGYRL